MNFHFEINVKIHNVLTRIAAILFSCMYFTYKRNTYMKKKQHYYSSQYDIQFDSIFFFVMKQKFKTHKSIVTHSKNAQYLQPYRKNSTILNILFQITYKNDFNFRDDEMKLSLLSKKFKKVNLNQAQTEIFFKVSAKFVIVNYKNHSNFNLILM